MHILLGLLVAFVLVVLFSRRFGETKRCRWRADRSGDRGALRKYQCATCGAEAFTSTDGPPQACKANQR